MKKEKYMPPLMTITAVDMQEVLLGVSYTHIPIENDGVNALGHDIGDEYEITVGNDGNDNQVGTGVGGDWGITWK